eukprot:6080794-Pyramimonas_sp.AAC.1
MQKCATKCGAQVGGAWHAPRTQACGSRNSHVVGNLGGNWLTCQSATSKRAAVQERPQTNRLIRWSIPSPRCRLDDLERFVSTASEMVEAPMRRIV